MDYTFTWWILHSNRGYRSISLKKEGSNRSQAPELWILWVFSSLFHLPHCSLSPCCLHYSTQGVTRAPALPSVCLEVPASSRGEEQALMSSLLSRFFHFLCSPPSQLTLTHLTPLHQDFMLLPVEPRMDLYDLFLHKHDPPPSVNRRPTGSSPFGDLLHLQYHSCDCRGDECCAEPLLSNTWAHLRTLKTPQNLFGVP